MKDTELQVQLANIATSLEMGRNGFAAKAYPEYLIEMRRIEPAFYEYTVSIAGDDGISTEVDHGKYRLRSGGYGVIDRWPSNDPYGEVAKMNVNAAINE